MAQIEERQADVGKLTPKMVADAQAIFDSWWERWSDIHDLNGGQGDTHALFAALWDSWKKAK
jgi:hypothetical protein